MASKAPFLLAALLAAACFFVYCWTGNCSTSSLYCLTSANGTAATCTQQLDSRAATNGASLRLFELLTTESTFTSLR